MRFILTADWHLRSSRPRCRLDADWMETQERALYQISDLAKKQDCPIIVVGDVFDTAAADVSFTLINMVQRWAAELPYPLYLLAGNHDLQYHDVANLAKSGIGILRESTNILPATELQNYYCEDGVRAFDFGLEHLEGNRIEKARIIFLHTLCFPDMKSIPPNVKATTALELLKKWPKSRYIFTGDYHKSFVAKKNGRYVINPGCLLRQAADEKDYQPSVFFVDTDTGTINIHPIEDDEELVTDEYLREAKQRESRIDAFVELLKTKGSMTMDFIKNVEARLAENPDLDDGTVACIRELVYGE